MDLPNGIQQGGAKIAQLVLMQSFSKQKIVIPDTEFSAEAGHAINWIESTCRSLQAEIPAASDCASYATDRLAMLLLDRLPSEVAIEMVALLPQDSGGRLRKRADRPKDATIAFPDFVEITRHVLGLSELLDQPEYADSETRYGELCERVAESFLWAVAQEFPMELKERMSSHLPSDLRYRMNLRTGYSGREKVA